MPDIVSITINKFEFDSNKFVIIISSNVSGQLYFSVEADEVELLDNREK